MLSSLSAQLRTPAARTALRRPLAAMPASRSLSTLGGPPPVGNPLDADKYTRGREAAFEWVRANGFSEDSCVEIPVAWGEQVRPSCAWSLQLARGDSALTLVVVTGRECPCQVSLGSFALLHFADGVALSPERAIGPPCVALESPRDCRLTRRSSSHSSLCSNAVFFRWLETGRLQNLSWLGTQIPEADAQALKGNGKGKGPILARITFDYGKPVAYPGESSRYLSPSSRGQAQCAGTAG